MTPRTIHTHRRSKGAFVFASLILAAFLASPARAAGDPQQQTVSDIRDVGTALFSWLVDQVSAVEGDDDLPEGIIFDLGAFTPITHPALSGLLVPLYIAEVPEVDGWGHPYEFFLNNDLLGAQVMAIRSSGADGQVSGDLYMIGPFPADDSDEDIVWSDGYFARWPEVDLLFLDGFESGDTSAWD